jgi:uncharacterized membrane protein
MKAKKIGVILIILSILVSFIVFQFVNDLNEEAEALGCYSEPSCVKLESSISVSHFAFGIIGFIFALGFYMILFNKGEEAIVKRLESDKERDIERREKELENSQFDIILKGLDEYEQKIMRAVREQEGITQSTLRIRTDMSKAKLSYVLQDLERKNLIKREKKGKTLAIFLRLGL